METKNLFATPVDGIVPTYLNPNDTTHRTEELIGRQAPRWYANGDETEIAKALAPLKGKTVYLYGFGAQSGNHARCLRSEGVKVKILGRTASSSSMLAAIEDGFEVVPLNGFDPDDADVLCFGIPDDQQVSVLPAILKRLDPYKTTLGFFHGMTVYYGMRGFYGQKLVQALDEGWNIFIVAPKGPGNTVWTNKQAGGGIACLFGAHEDSPDLEGTEKLAMAYATALGGYKGIMIDTSFLEETVTDHFGEQGVLCGVMFYATYFMINLLQQEFGYSPEEAQQKVEQEIIKVGHLIRRGGAKHALTASGRKVISNAEKWASAFYGQPVSIGDMLCEGLENTGFDLRLHQPHLSPVDAVGKTVAGEKLKAPSPLTDVWEGGILGILLTASSIQYQLGIEAGYSQPGMQFEVQQEIALITDCYLRGGLSYMIMRISTTAKHGMFVSGRYIVESQEISVRERFANVLGAIQDGSYAKQTKMDLVDIPRGDAKDWLWEAVLAVVTSPEEMSSIEQRPSAREDFQGNTVNTLVVTFSSERPWDYEFLSQTGEIVPA